MDIEANSNPNFDLRAGSEDQELPPANEDILRTGHVRVFKPGVAGPQYDVMLQNQLTEIKQGQDTRRMLTQIIEEKKNLKSGKSNETQGSSVNRESDEKPEGEAVEDLLHQLLEATKDYRKTGGSMLKRKSKNLVSVAAAWKKSILQSSKVSSQNKEELAKYGEKDLCSMHIKCANTKCTSATGDSDGDDDE